MTQHQNDIPNNGTMFTQRWPSSRYPTQSHPIANLLPTLCQLYFHFPLTFIIAMYIVVNWLRYRPTSSIYLYNICLIRWIPPDVPSGEGTPPLHTLPLSAPRCFDPPCTKSWGDHEPGKGPAPKPYAKAPRSLRPALKAVKYILATELNLGGKQFVRLVWYI